MGSIFPDTSPEMESLWADLLREAPPWQKLDMLAGLNQAARELALAGLRRRYPLAPDSELKRRLADLLLGEDLARRVYGDLDDGL